METAVVLDVLVPDRLIPEGPLLRDAAGHAAEWIWVDGRASQDAVAAVFLETVARILDDSLPLAAQQPLLDDALADIG